MRSTGSASNSELVLDSGVEGYSSCQSAALGRSPPRPAHHVIAQLAGIGEIRHLPAVEVVLRHAFLGEALESVGIARRLRAEQARPR